MSDDASHEHAGLRELLHRPDPVFCAFLTLPDPGIAAIVGRSGFDFVLLDAEHGPFSVTSARHCLDALGATPAMTAIRVAANDPTLIKQALDLGVDGVMVPKIGAAAAAAAVVRASRYPPEGSRGLGTGHASLYGNRFREYVAEANQKVAVMVIIEDAAGVENADEIVAVDGVDAIMIGSTDLSADLGVPGETDDERVTEAIARVVGSAVEAGVKVGTGCAPDEVSALGRLGMGLFACYFDGSAIGASAAEAVRAAENAWRDR